MDMILGMRTQLLGQLPGTKLLSPALQEPAVQKRNGLVSELRQKWQNLFIKRIRCPSKPWSQQDETVIQTLVSVLGAEEQEAGLQQPTGIGQRPRPMSSVDGPRSSVRISKTSPQLPTHTTNDKMGKCCFNPKWQQNPKYKWANRNPGIDHEAQCCLCRKSLKLGTMGLMALDSHMKSAKHVARAKAHQQQAPKAQFCSEQGSSVTTFTAATASNTDDAASSVLQPVTL
ncbi:hypothetical protein GOODEAATRI_010983 [Goodea atripinnis]|uniref:Uncharacterized protein n=1 Tax=Goodea atripinnis TaxID=208336 RepID=A0ABV0P4V1_9TELE